MADSAISLDNLKSFYRSQVYDEEKWALNMVLQLFPVIVLILGVEKLVISLQKKVLSIGLSLDPAPLHTSDPKLLRAAGLFAGSIFLMRNYGDLMAI
ncbi:hypothetical protein JRO89_XS13G0260100 [Xanthoceras sorbifolium]|uniref:Uncharacterized protein n=1 Tax=Xanthoceras sorbifolium TaxID=99658 RepID=A0ABQ8HA02_9ROSI|nr:hypothetical protein JRO89_XS13G0260100 [Xanthoceras sorbifolium]